MGAPQSSKSKALERPRCRASRLRKQDLSEHLQNKGWAKSRSLQRLCPPLWCKVSHISTGVGVLWKIAKSLWLKPPKAILKRNVFSGYCLHQLPMFPRHLCLLGLFLTCVVLTSHLGPRFSPQDFDVTPDWLTMAWLVPSELPSKVLWHIMQRWHLVCVLPLHLPKSREDIN